MHFKTCIFSLGLMSGMLFDGTATARAVDDIQIAVYGKSSSDDAESIRRCEQFRPTIAQLHRYFSGAYPISKSTREKLYTSTCYSEGRVVFSRGDTADWRVYSNGGATLDWGGESAQLLNPEKIWSDSMHQGRPVKAAIHPIKRLRIERSGKVVEPLSPPDPVDADLCKRFRPTRAQLIRYFSRAEAVPSFHAIHQYYSPCYAEGWVIFKDGEQGHWHLRSSGFASLTWLSGDSVDLRYRPNDWNDPFDGYDEG